MADKGAIWQKTEMDLSKLVRLLFIALVVPPLLSQTLQFDAATIKPGVGQATVNGVVGFTQGGRCRGVDDPAPPSGPLPPTPLGRCVFTNVSLKLLVALAYPDTTGIPINTRITGGPGWVNSEQFEVQGAAADPATTTHAQLLSMLQRLLTDRFKLQWHHESKQMQGFALLPAKGGPKVNKGTGDVTQAGASFSRGTGKIYGMNSSMASLARTLGGYVGGPVSDETGLEGTYEFTLPLTASANEERIAEIMSGLPEYLGLRLESRKVTVDIMVIDNVEKPEP